MYASFCPVKYDVNSVLLTEGSLNVNIGHIVYTDNTTSVVWCVDDQCSGLSVKAQQTLGEEI